MPVFLLCLKCKLENIAKMSLPDDYRFDLTLKNSSGDDTRDVMFTAEEELATSKGRGKVHFMMKWDKTSKVEATVTVLEIKGVTRSIEEGDSESFVPVIGFECRGAEPVAFRPGMGFVVESSGGKVIEDVDLSDLDWCDFDEDKGVSIGVYEMESMFQVHRK